ncbi:LOW QUALITY PROTEIN: putative RNA polymerase sigma factor [Geomicrobium sp. JCM 19055]|nr:LOW QUALITY PROTEIN: putative RNA polymerase sigma factor [Geomicrobium sp. JCM 19055]
MYETFDRLYEQYHQSLFQFIFYMVRDRHVAEELVQDVYIKVFHSYDRFDGRSNEKTWLFSIAKHVTIDYIRKENRQKKEMVWHGRLKNHTRSQPLPEQRTIAKEELEVTYRALGKCSVDQQQVLILRFIESFTVKETAEALGWSESKVKTTQHRAILKLKKTLREEEEKHES